jgi:hypothetical protein
MSSDHSCSKDILKGNIKDLWGGLREIHNPKDQAHMFDFGSVPGELAFGGAISVISFVLDKGRDSRGDFRLEESEFPLLKCPTKMFAPVAKKIPWSEHLNDWLLKSRLQTDQLEILFTNLGIDPALEVEEFVKEYFWMLWIEHAWPMEKKTNTPYNF